MKEAYLLAKKVNLDVKKDEKTEKILNEGQKKKIKKKNKLKKKEFKEKYQSCIVKETLTG